MKKTVLLLSLLTAFAACRPDSANTKEDELANAAEAAEKDIEMAPDATETDNTEAEADSDAVAETAPGESAAAQQAPTSAANPLFNLTLRKGQAGAVRIGMSIDDLRAQYGENKINQITLQQEGTEVTAYEILGERYRPDLRVEQECKGNTCKVWRITVLNPAFKTQDGIGIGSMFRDVKQRYNIKQVAMGEGNFVAISEDMKMSFLLDMRGIPADRRSKLKVDDVPGSTLVSGVMLF